MGRHQGTTAYGAAGEARIEEEDGQAVLGPPDEVHNQSSLTLRDKPQAFTTVINGMYFFFALFDTCFTVMVRRQLDLYSCRQLNML